MSNDSVSPVYGVRKSSLLNLAGKYNLPSPSLNSDPAKVLLATSTSAPPLPFSTPPISPDKLPLHSSSTPPPSYFSPQSKHSTAQSKTPPSNPSAKTSPIPVINVRPAPDQISSQLLFPSPIRLQPSSADQGQNLSEPKNPPAASKYDIFLPPLAEKQPAGNNNAITKKKETDSDGGVSQREVVPVDERVKKNPKDWHFFISCRSTSDIPACLALKKELLNIAKDSTKCSFAIKVYIHMPQHIRNNYKSKTAKPSHQPPKPATPLKPTSAPQSPIIRKPNKQSTQVFISVSSLFDSDPEPNDAENSDLKRVDEDEFLLSESEEFNTMQVLNGTCCFIPVISSDCLDGLSGLKNGFEDEDFVLWLVRDHLFVY
ncbi:hypothetical protein HK098_006996 [Nowakowskiella sp. JEL0407]|nr:hypothetical protein HK098_006996 [Nowakowskiella sp. JEL0407]